MNKYLLKLIMIFTIFFLFVSINIIQADNNLFKYNLTKLKIDNNVFYVGGSGLNNYTLIQDAIDNSNNGDTVYVFSQSSPYFENLIIDKQICLIGEDKNTTIVDGNGIGDVIKVFYDNVFISGFSVRNNGENPNIDSLIKLFSDGNTIVDSIISNSSNYTIGIFLNSSSNNIIRNNLIFQNGNEGIFIKDSKNNLIENNSIYKNFHCAIVISNSSDNYIFYNNMYENHATISLWPYSTKNEIAYNKMYNQEWDGIGIWEESNYNNIHDNNLYDNGFWSIKITSAKGNIIQHNNISGCDTGIFLKKSYFNKIKNNNIFDCTIHGSFENSSFNRWVANYWDGHLKFLPKRIDGTICLFWNESIYFNWINFDWRPAKIPYDIEVL